MTVGHRRFQEGLKSQSPLRLSFFPSAYCNFDAMFNLTGKHRCFAERNSSIIFSQCHRSMTTSKTVQDRSKKKRVHDLEIVTEKHKILSKILLLFEVLKKEPQRVISIRELDRYRTQINLPKPHKISGFLRKSPKLFELYKDHRGVLWVGMTKEAEGLVEEEEVIIEKHSDKAAEVVTRMLMMSVDKRLALDKIVHFRRDLGLPMDFRNHWVRRFPDHFRVVKPYRPYDESEYLELVNWRSSWAMTELERKALAVMQAPDDHVAGVLSLSFPMKFPPNYKQVLSRYKGKIEDFQKREYLSPYADARELKAGTLEFNKRAVAVMHELLSFTIGKRLVTDYLTHFRKEFVMPQKLMRLLLKHFGIFYVSERGKRFHVFLNSAYEDSELIEKHPLIVWREKVLSLVGYRKKKDTMDPLTDLKEFEYNDTFESESEDESVQVDNNKQTIGSLEGDFPENESEMEIDEVYLGVCFVNAGLNRYIEQLVASAEAAVEEVIRRGVSDPNKIAVGGHSYGAFMTANLLAHAPHLFCCGIAISGAYNRTLTPFGFQNEEGTLWEATHTYVEMSPFMSANKIKKPILLIHGEEDNNPGTLTMQLQFNKKKLLGDEARSTCCNLDV
ncbi:putative glutamyl endopeptidase, chloroplastic [Capsicum chinense]|nr:putative glutamyl endopeptidase, chloroplastic [Capsicum chinense]